jgi:hypothetical protein
MHHSFRAGKFETERVQGIIDQRSPDAVELSLDGVRIANPFSLGESPVAGDQELDASG